MSSEYRDQYLETYWPPKSNNADMWLDNLELLHAYYSAALEILRVDGKHDVLDISTGPCLAPLMATMACIDQVQLSDFDEGNREYLKLSDIEYWRAYADELAKLFPAQNLNAEDLLTQLDAMRKLHAPLDVDLRREPMFLPATVNPQSVGLLTMHFVVDSICKTKEECFVLLDKSLTLVRPHGWLLLSALIESDGWKLGEVEEPSPRLHEQEINNFLEGRSFNVLLRFRSTPKPKQTYDGKWTVFLARKGQ